MTDHDHHSVVLTELKPQHRALRQMIPEVYDGFGALSRASLGTGAVDAKIKELIAMVIGVVEGCDGCIACTREARPARVPPSRRRPRSSASAS